jgi:hypothetical protein
MGLTNYSIAFAHTKYAYQFCVFIIITNNLVSISDQSMDLTNGELWSNFWQGMRIFSSQKHSDFCLGSIQPPIYGKQASCSGSKAASAGSQPLTPVISTEAKNK